MKRNWLLAGALGLIAAILYFVSVAGYAYPGDGAHLMAVWRGLEVDDVVRYPLMAIFAKALGGGNLIAPICGTISVFVFFHLIAAFIHHQVRGEKQVMHRRSIATVSALAATIVFMLTPAVRSAATHLEPRMFDFTWALLAFALAIPFFRLPKWSTLVFPVLLGAMVALGFLDTALFVAFSPFYVALVVMQALKQKRKPYLPVFLFALAAFVTFFVARAVLDLEVAPLLKNIAAELKEYRKTPGWVFVVIFTTLPFVTAIFSSAKAFGKQPGLVEWLFHGAMSFVSILAIATRLSPSALMEPYAILPVATSAFAAAVAGYLVAYWWINRRTVIAMVSGGIFVFVLLVSCTWYLFSFDGDAGDFADKVARKILTDLGSRRWFITDGTIDDHIKLVAAQEGKQINIISLARDLDKKYLERLGALVEKEGVGGSKNAALRMSLSLGVLPFVQDWFASDPTVAKDVAIFGAPDLWYSANITPVPEFFFFGADPAKIPDWSAWKEFNSILSAPKGWGSYHDRKSTDPADRMRLSLRRHLGFVANNRGVYLQDQKRDDDAFAMYELVLNEIDHDNICAIFNEVGMVNQNHAKALSKKKELDQMIKTITEDKNRRYLLWRLGTYYGYVRDPDAFVRLGYTWARSGRPGEALSQIRRAIDFVPTDKKTILLNMMASLYANENDQKKSREIYEEVLAKDANNHDALIGMMRLALLEGNNAKALEYLQRAAENSGQGKRAKIELAMVAMMKNDLENAKSLVRSATDYDPNDMQAWSLMAAIVMQQIDAAKDDKQKAALLKELEASVLPSMETKAADKFDYYLQSTKGFVLLRQGTEEKRKEARDAFVVASKSRPDMAATQDMVLNLDISLDDKENAEEHAKEVLRRNRKAPLANYVLGSIALGNGKYAEAETYLRIAADAPQPVIYALNDLAEVLRRNKNYAEAERYARKGTEKAPNFYVIWETLGSILMDANRNLDEAEACIRKACQLSKDQSGKEVDVRMLISLARVQLRRDDAAHAKVTIRKVRARIDELSEYEKREFEEFTKSVK